MTSVPHLLRRFDLTPRKGLGQNFLVDEVHLARIVAAAELTAADVVLEIGPGLGALTARLAKAAGCVVAVELDERLLAALAESGGSQQEAARRLGLNPSHLSRLIRSLGLRSEAGSMR